MDGMMKPRVGPKWKRLGTLSTDDALKPMTRPIMPRAGQLKFSGQMNPTA